jgi:phosphoglycolate phosphatase
MRSVIFDLDGTLADTSADLIAAANACLSGMGAAVRLDPAADAAIAFRGGRAMLRAGLARAGAGERAGAGAGAGAGDGADEAEVERWYPRLLDAYEARIDAETRLYPGAVEAAEALRRAGLAVGVCTNKPERLARLLLARLGVAGTFSALVGADTLPVRKPDPAPFHEAVARAGGVRGRAMLVGDTVTDRDTARAAHAPVALVTFGPEGRAVADLAPDALLDAYEALPGLAARLLP